MTTIVFLHIPKTAGQTIHNAIAAAVGWDAVSPIRVHTQAEQDQQLPPGYRLYSGHIDWTELDTLPQNRFVFTILRDPRERIASFYFYLRKEARALTEELLADPANLGKRRALKWSADDYFFGGDTAWNTFIRDHYDNFYCSYFATRKMRGRSEIAFLPTHELLERALLGTASVSHIYPISRLSDLERDLERVLGKPIRVTETYANPGPLERGRLRWPELLKCFEHTDAARRMEEFITKDLALLSRIGMG